MKLGAHRYGKNRVRLLKVLHGGDVHTVKEVTARVMLAGAFARSFTDADNTRVIATDTIKNALQVLAYDHLGAEIEPFARTVADHFLERYAHVAHVSVKLDERVWTRLQIPPGPGQDPAAHPHGFVQADVAKPFTRLIASDGRIRHESGIRDLFLLKSTGSGFEGFHRDELTTLADTRERILASPVRALWRWARVPPAYAPANRAIVAALLVPFAGRYSPSVQATLYEMATAALDACAEISRITLVMPNVHCLPVDLRPFGRSNRHELFVPTDEPHGVIEATVCR